MNPPVFVLYFVSTSSPIICELLILFPGEQSIKNLFPFEKFKKKLPVLLSFTYSFSIIASLIKTEDVTMFISLSSSNSVFLFNLTVPP